MNFIRDYFVEARGPSFEPEKYAGHWYEIKRYDNEFFKSYDCIQHLYTWDGEKTKARACEKQKTSYVCREAFFYMNEPDRVPLEGRMNFVGTKRVAGEGSMNVLATDYENFLILFTCDNLPGNKSFQMLWILSRTTKLNETVTEEVEKLISDYFVPEAVFPVYQEDDFCEPRKIP